VFALAGQQAQHERSHVVLQTVWLGGYALPLAYTSAQKDEPLTQTAHPELGCKLTGLEPDWLPAPADRYQPRAI